MRFEHKHEPLLPRTLYYLRLARHLTIALVIVVGSLLMGMVGYRVTEGMSWIDAMLNASMLLGGMGPVNVVQTVAGKLFASFYALYSGLVFLIVAGVLFAPIFHRFTHRFHLGMEDDDDN